MRLDMKLTRSMRSPNCIQIRAQTQTYDDIISFTYCRANFYFFLLLLFYFSFQLEDDFIFSFALPSSTSFPKRPQIHWVQRNVGVVTAPLLYIEKYHYLGSVIVYSHVPHNEFIS